MPLDSFIHSFIHAFTHSHSLTHSHIYYFKTLLSTYNTLGPLLSVGEVQMDKTQSFIMSYKFTWRDARKYITHYQPDDRFPNRGICEGLWGHQKGTGYICLWEGEAVSG